MKMRGSAILVSLGSNVRRIRKDAGLTQEELAIKCGLDRTYISGIERGLRNPSFDKLLLLSYHLQCHPSQFFDNISIHII